jgi:hypothetical protein
MIVMLGQVGRERAGIRVRLGLSGHRKEPGARRGHAIIRNGKINHVGGWLGFDADFRALG